MELLEKRKQLASLLNRFKNIALNLSEGEFTLGDLIAEEEDSLKNCFYEIQELLKDIVSDRMWIEFEVCSYF